MFEEQYRRDNDKLRAKDTLLMDILQKADMEKKAQKRRARFVRYGAAAAAVVLVIGGTVGALASHNRKPSANDMLMTADAADTTAVAAPRDAALVDAEITSYDDLFTLVDSLQYQYKSDANGQEMGVMTESVAQEAPAAPEELQGSASDSAAYAGGNRNEAETDSMSAGSDYSETNVQVKGVDEADIVKTDGKYIYYTAGGQFVIIAANGAETSILSVTNFLDGEDWWGSNTEMFLSGDRLMIVTQGYNTVWVNAKGSSVGMNQDQTRVYLYDVANREKPKKIASLGQSGYYVSSRMIGDYVYLVTSQYVYSVYRDQISTYCPVVYDGTEAHAVAIDDIYVYDRPSTPEYTVIGAIDFVHGDQYASSRAVLGSASDLYVNASHMLLAAAQNDREVSDIAPDQNGKNVQITTSSTSTRLMLFSLDGAKIDKIASGMVKGTLLNQFSMDEYQDVFRIVTTVSEWEQKIYTDGVDAYENNSENYNCLYTLDGTLNLLGKIENLAKDEWVESVRFDGDIGYFVTFRQTDPLFTVDLSDPKNPRLLSTLKIPGFSEYLHVYGEGLLLGIGYSADEENGWREGVKISMFDTANPKNVSEITSLRLDAGWSMIGSNHKAVLVNRDKNIIAFPADNKYYVFSYDEAAEAFVQQSVVSVSDDIWSYNMRGLFIDDNLYVVSESAVIVISMTDYTRIAKVIIP